MRLLLIIFILLATELAVSTTYAAGDQPETPAITEFQIRYLDSSEADVVKTGAQRAMDMGAHIGETLAHVRAGKDGGQILRINRKLTRAQAWEIANRMVLQGGLMYAEPIDPAFNPDEPEPASPPPVEPSDNGGKP